MNAPKHQHFIPVSYLKNFAVQKDGKYFVEAKLKTDDQPRSSLISIRDICVDKNLYTIPNATPDDKYKLEEFYATHIDSVYPDVYQFLINPNINVVSRDQKAQILMATMSLFFRTPKFLNHNKRRLDILLNHAVENHQDKNGNVKFSFRDYSFDFHVSQLEEYRSNLIILQKMKFLHSHLKDLHEFVKFKLNDAINVYTIYEEMNLITSDNPVVMHSYVGNQFNVFDPTNFISLPLDEKHFLLIMPNETREFTDHIFRGLRDKTFALTTNLEVDKGSDDWIMGKPGTVTAHLNDQVKYNEHTEENFQMVDDLKEKSFDLLELSKVSDEFGFLHQKTADKVTELRKKRIHQTDPEFIKLVLILESQGFTTK